jgi:large subunit ribosomal protein L16
MLLSPRKFKYKKSQKGSLPNKILSCKRELIFGSFGLKSLDFGLLTANQIEAGRRLIMKKIKKKGKLWVRIFPHIPISKKPIEVRMGKGKGGVDHWAFKANPGILLYEIEGLSYKKAFELFRQVSKKLPIKTKIYAIK